MSELLRERVGVEEARVGGGVVGAGEAAAQEGTHLERGEAWELEEKIRYSPLPSTLPARSPGPSTWPPTHSFDSQVTGPRAAAASGRGGSHFSFSQNGPSARPNQGAGYVPVLSSRRMTL